MKNVNCLLIIIVLVLLFTGCESFTVRNSPDAFRTGKVLNEGEIRVTTNSVMVATIPLPGLEWSATRGLPYDSEAGIGWGVHALTYETGDSDDENDFYHGPEFYFTKNLLNIDDRIYLAGTFGSEINVLPSFDAAFHGGAAFSFYPLTWFTIFGHAKLLYHTAGYFAPQAGIGLGLEGPVVVKIAAYTRFHSDMKELEDDTYFFPFYYGAQLGFRFKSRE